MNTKLVQDIGAKMREKQTHELLVIWSANDRQQWSDEAFEAISMVLKERNVPVPGVQRNEKETLPFGENQDLKDYVLHASGMTRTTLNVTAFVGVFIFGWLIAVIFDSLGKKGRGWSYLILIAILVFGVAKFLPVAALLGIAIYGVAWLDANLVLSGYKQAARQRLSAMSQQEASANAILERGLLLHKVLNDKALAVPILTSALRCPPEGDPHMLYQAGLVMATNERYSEACQFYDRASADTKDPALLKLIASNRKAAAKRSKPYETKSMGQTPPGIMVSVRQPKKAHSSQDISLTCTSCKQPISVPKEWAGERIRCPTCSNEMAVRESAYTEPRPEHVP